MKLGILEKTPIEVNTYNYLIVNANKKHLELEVKLIHVFIAISISRDYEYSGHQLFSFFHHHILYWKKKSNLRWEGQNV